MKRNILAICDPEQEYAYRLMDALSRREEFPFEILSFTSVDMLQKGLRQKPAQLLLLSQSAYQSGTFEWPAAQILLLWESEDGSPAHLPCISKYSSVTRLCKKITETAEELGKLPMPAGAACPVQIVGIYTPVGRCLQTTFAIVFGQLLARHHKVLYLNFESCSGLSRVMGRSFETDFSNLLYFLKDSPEEIQKQLYRMTEQLNGMDMVPPAFSGFDIFQIQKEEWLKLLAVLESSKYEYVILDLAEGVQGLLDILHRCSRVYTITREDGFAQAKLNQYEEILKRAEYEDVLERTKKIALPLFQKLPRDLNHITNCELTQFVERMLTEDEN